MLGQASGNFLESSSSLRILHAGIRNTVGVLAADAFTQANPAGSATGVSTQVDTSKRGVLSGSVAFTRPDAGPDMIGGVGSVAPATAGVRPLGVFVNSALGNPFENTPGAASGKGTYMSGMGTYGNKLFETYNINSGAALTYATGDQLWASLNGFLTNVTAANNVFEGKAPTSGDAATINGATLIGVLKMPADASQNELIYDQRI